MKTAISPTALHFHDIASHFLALTAGDRFLRFGWVMTDVDIVAYVERLLEAIGEVFVVVDPAPDISGVLHMEFASGGAELGLSVSAWARGQGIGALLLERAGLLAAARGVRTLFARNLSFNAALRRLALRTGMQVACAPSTRSTRLELPPARSEGIRRHCLLGNITLADHALRYQWSGAAPARPAAALQPERVPD